MSGSTFQPPIHLDPNQDPGQQTAFINQNFQSLATSLNPFIVSDGTTNRIILGKQGDGTYGLKVSQVGVDVGTATNSQLIFNSNQDIFKIVSTGTATLVAANPLNNGSRSTVTVAHGQSSPPAVVAYLQGNGSAYTALGTFYTLPYTEVGVFIVYSYTIDSTNITFYVSNNSGGNITNLGTSTFKYYILQETAN